jgi:hypothetical protein
MMVVMKYILIVAGIIGVIVVGNWLDHIPRGATQNYASKHCAAGQNAAGDDGFACTAKTRKYGWPIVTMRKFTGVTPTKDGFNPPVDNYAESPSGSPNTGGIASISNIILLVIVIAIPLSIWRWRAMRDLNATIDYQQHHGGV